MTNFIIRRILYLIPMLFFISVLSFIIIQLPPGDYVTTYVSALEQDRGYTLADEEISQLREYYGLNAPMYVRYLKWVQNMLLYGDFGKSLDWKRPVSEILFERIPLTILLSLSSLLFVWAVAIPVGIYSATHQYTLFDYIFTFFGFIGLATPNFLLALILMYLALSYFGVSVGGLFSPAYITSPWSFGKFLDLLNHIWIPMIVIGTAGTAGLIRVMRGSLLDELRKQYVVTARSKGVSEGKLLFKYPLRVAINPVISTIGWTLPALICGETLTAIVLSLPTTGPVLLRALMTQDMFLAGSIIMILSSLTIIGSLISDILLVYVDPRIRFEEK